MIFPFQFRLGKKKPKTESDNKDPLKVMHFEAFNAKRDADLKTPEFIGWFDKVKELATKEYRGCPYLHELPASYSPLIYYSSYVTGKSPEDVVGNPRHTYNAQFGNVFLYSSSSYGGNFPMYSIYWEDPDKRVPAFVTQAAMLINGEVHVGERHGDIIHRLANEGFATPVQGDEGFVDEDGEFLTREEAAGRALHNGQIRELRWGKQLYSEDLY